MSNETIPLNLFKANLELQLRLQRLMQENRGLRIFRCTDPDLAPCWPMVYFGQ